MEKINFNCYMVMFNRKKIMALKFVPAQKYTKTCLSKLSLKIMLNTTVYVIYNSTRLLYSTNNNL